MHKRTTIEKICEACGNTYSCGQDKLHIRRYCSLKCVPRPKRSVEQTTKVALTCVGCEQVFYVFPSLLNGKGNCCQFCGRECRKRYTARKNSAPLTLERVKECLHYDPETGIFTWLKMPSYAPPMTEVGKRAGWEQKGKKNYRFIEFLGKNYAEHRLAWFYMTGEWPTRQIDHKDRKKNNNKWDNLREATNSQNQANREYKKGKRLYRGVRTSLSGKKFEAIIGEPPKYLGSFDSPEEAHRAYCEAAKDRYGEFFDPQRI